MDLTQIVKELGNAVWQGAKGAALVQQWENYRYESACQQISMVVAEAVRSQNKELLGSLFTAFADRIKASSSWESQNHLSHLLWHYKITLDAHL